MIPHSQRDLKEVLRIEPGHRQAREDLSMVRSQKAELDQARYNEAFKARAARGQGSPTAHGQGGGGGLGLGALSPEERRQQMQMLAQMGLDPAAIEQMMAAEAAAAAGGGLGGF